MHHRSKLDDDGEVTDPSGADAANDVPRPLRTAERAVLDELLSHEFDGAVALRAQMQSVTVVANCRCGCPTIDLEVCADAPRADIAGPLAPVELIDTSTDPEGTVLLFIRDGVMWRLEYVWYGDGPRPDWPTREQLAVY
jgi:hypothetical protein